MLSLHNLKKSIKGKKIVDDISFDIQEGTINGLLGPNGAGKTTTFYLIAGLIKLDQGYIHFDNQDISKLPMHRRSKMGIKYLPQEPSIFQNLTVYQNLLGLAEISFIDKVQIDTFVERSILLTSVNTEGIRSHLLKDSVLRFKVVSSSEPPSM